MKKLHSYAFYALVAPAMTLGASSVLAQQTAGQPVDSDQQSTQYDQRGTQSTQRDRSAPQSTPGTTQHDRGASQTAPVAGQHDQRDQRDQSTRGLGQSDAQAGADRRGGQDQYGMQSRDNIDSVPERGMQASNLMGADVKTSGGENVGSVDDLILDEDGHVVAIVVGVGGFLGMGQRDVAIGWDHITRTGDSDDYELRVNMTRDDLRAAPEFKNND